MAKEWADRAGARGAAVLAAFNKIYKIKKRPYN
jgi:hypothetical protein